MSINPVMSTSVDVGQHRRPRSNGRRTATFGGAFAALMAGAVALAAWTSTGTGSSQDVTAGTAGALTVSPVTPATTGLVPGTSKTSQFTVANANSYAVTLSSVTVTGLTITGGTGCTAANAAVTSSVGASAVGTSVAGGGSPVSSPDFVVTLTMGAGSADGCQGATFTPQLSVSGASS